MSKTKLFLQGLTLFALALSTGCSSSTPNGYYENDGPPGLFQKKILPWGGSEVKLKVEQPNKWANRPYTVMGKRYYPVTGDKAMNQVGTASWYGKQFHGKKTAIGEVYDMHAMTAAHPTMELPSFAKVTNLENGRSVIVRVNDRGPFLHGRIIDLSYAAAVKLGYQKKGTARVRVERITRRDIAAGRIPSTTADNAVLVASSSKKSTTAPAPTRTASAAPRQTQTTTYRQSTTQLTQTYEPAPAPAAEQTVTPAAKPAPIPSGQPRAVAANEGTLVSDTTAHNSKYDDQVYVTLSIPVENAETPPEEQTPVQNDAMGALIAQQETAPAQAPAEVLPSRCFNRILVRADRRLRRAGKCQAGCRPRRNDACLGTKRSGACGRYGQSVESVVGQFCVQGRSQSIRPYRDAGTRLTGFCRRAITKETI